MTVTEFIYFILNNPELLNKWIVIKDMNSGDEHYIENLEKAIDKDTNDELCLKIIVS